nr:MAG: replication initiator protein [Microviridae sp.]
MCLFPQIRKNPKYKATKKNGGNIPAVIDERVKYVPMACNRCMQCHKQKANNWKIRLKEEIKTDCRGIFVTLTFTTKSLQELKEKINNPNIKGYALDNAIATKAVRYFNENHRKHHHQQIKHWLITELGHGKYEHMHLHGLIWTDLPYEEIKRLWRYGYSWLGSYVNGNTINYISKYITKKDYQHKEYVPKILNSPYIGKQYTNTIRASENKFKGETTREYYQNDNGTKLALPIYYRNKLYTDEEKEKLWINRLDKGIRYIKNIAIDTRTKEGLTKYLKALKVEQERSIRHGFGTDVKNWTQIEYEEQMREVKIAERLENKNTK